MFPAVDRFSKAVAEIGLELELGKLACYFPNGGLESCAARPHECPIGMRRHQDGRTGCGLKIGGVSVGDQMYVDSFLKR